MRIKEYAFSHENSMSIYLLLLHISLSSSNQMIWASGNQIVSAYTACVYIAPVIQLCVKLSVNADQWNREDLPPSIVPIRSSSHERSRRERDRRSTIITVPNCNQTNQSNVSRGRARIDVQRCKQEKVKLRKSKRICLDRAIRVTWKSYSCFSVKQTCKKSYLLEIFCSRNLSCVPESSMIVA